MELGVLHSLSEDRCRATSQFEEREKMLEEKLKSAYVEKETFGEVRYKQGRFGRMHIGPDLGFDKGYHSRYITFPHGEDMGILVEGYWQKIFNQIWHSMIFLKEASRLAHKYFEVAIAMCQSNVD